MARFQSTLPRRERRRCAPLNAAAAGISIHAPAKGATVYDNTVISHVNFNPRSREGSDLQCDGVSKIRLKFQSTLPRRERPGHPQGVRQGGRISIHAPAKGATQQPHPYAAEAWISIHAPAKGATLKTVKRPDGRTISIHAPAKGATAKITKTIPNDFCKINNYNNSFA